MEKSFLNYERNLRLTSEWILKSIKHGNGGSCAYYSPLRDGQNLILKLQGISFQHF